MRRYADVICPAHLSEALTLWPARDGHAVIPPCPDCSAALSDVGGGDPLVRALPFLSQQDFTEEIAYHEAAHAAIGVVLGLPLQFVRVRDGGGYNRYADQVEAPMERMAAMTWAGQLGARIWLAQRQEVTTHDLVDISFLGHGDADQLREWGVQGEELREAKRTAEGLLWAFWPQVEQVAAELVRSGWLTGTQVKMLVLASSETSSQALAGSLADA